VCSRPSRQRQDRGGTGVETPRRAWKNHVVSWRHRPSDSLLPWRAHVGAAIRRGQQSGKATGVDYAPNLLEQGRERARAEHLRVDFKEADAENLPFPDTSFDLVLSAVGVMFAPNQERTADELSLVREAIYGDLSWSRRRALHRAVADRLEGLRAPTRAPGLRLPDGFYRHSASHGVPAALTICVS
jgi:hypothetical protein